MDAESVERIRGTSFNVSRRGYDRAEVDAYLAELADWLEGRGTDEARSGLIQREIERIGEQTAGVLASAGEAAATITGDAEEQAHRTIEEAKFQANATRIEADRYAEQTRSEADEFATTARGTADGYAQERRAEAETEAERLVTSAREESEQMLVEGRAGRAELETVISDLKQRRNALLDELEGLASSLSGTATKHRHPDTTEEERPEPVEPDPEEAGEDAAGEMELPDLDDGTRPDAGYEGADSETTTMQALDDEMLGDADADAGKAEPLTGETAEVPSVTDPERAPRKRR